MQQNQPLVSIITPGYNSAKWIAACIDSVKAQTYSNWEQLIVVDIGTTDDTEQIVNSYIEKDARIRFIKITDQKGLALSRNKAIREAKGSLIAFLDSDDLWMPTKLEKQVQFMQENKFAMTCTGFRRVSEDLSSIGIYRRPFQNVEYWSILANNRIACLTVMIDIRQTGPIQFKETIHEDFLLWLTILKKGFRCGGLDLDLARYRIVQTSRSSNKLKMAKVRWRILRVEEKLSFFSSLYYLFTYAYTSILKYRKF